MFKRGLVALTFVAVLATAGLGFSSSATAFDNCNPAVAYPYPTVAAYPPQVAYYPPAPVRSYPVFYGHVDDHHHHHHHPGLTFSIGF